MVKNSKNLLFYKATRTLAKMIKIKIFRTLEINKAFSKRQGMFIQEKWLYLIKNSELCDILPYPISTSLSPVPF